MVNLYVEWTCIEESPGNEAWYDGGRERSQFASWKALGMEQIKEILVGSAEDESLACQTTCCSETMVKLFLPLSVVSKSKCPSS